MVLENKLYNITLSNGASYSVVSKSFDEAINMIRKWRPRLDIIRIEESSATIITKKDIENATD